MSFKDKYCGMTGLSHAPHKKESAEVNKIMRSKHAKGGSPRSQHYLGEGVVKGVKGAYKGVKGAVDTAKTGVRNTKQLYRDTKELAGEAKKGIETGKKIIGENASKVKEHVGSIGSRAKSVLGSAKKLIGRKDGGSVPMKRQKHSAGEDIARALGPSVMRTFGVRPKRRATGGSTRCAPREKHYLGALAGAAKMALPLAKMAAPAIVGWGVTKALNSAGKKKKREENFRGGQIKHSRTLADFKKMHAQPTQHKESEERENHAAGGAGKVRKNQYDY